MITISRIVWPTDFSELSVKAGRYAWQLHQVFRGELHLLHVCSHAIVAPAVLDQSTGDLMVGETNLDEQSARDRLERLRSDEFQADPAVRCTVRIGTAWREICSYSDEVGADLIIIGTHGRTGLRHALIGSTAERVVQHASCPVLTVKSMERDFVATSFNPET